MGARSPSAGQERERKVNACACWQLDAIYAHQFDAEVKAQPFQVWKLTVTGWGGGLKGHSGYLTVTDGDSDKAIVGQEFPLTDFPLPEITLWFENQTLLLPGEH